MSPVTRFSLRLLPTLLLVGGAALSSSQPAAKQLNLKIGQSVVLDYPTDVQRISTSNPEVVDAVAVSKREVLLHTKSPGEATVVIWSEKGQRTFYSAVVENNLEPIRDLLKETFPDEDVHVQAARDSLSLTGTVHSQEASDRAAALVAPLAKSVVNNLRVAPGAAEKQILLKVVFAELNRTASDEFGVNLVSTGAGNTPGQITTGQFSSASANTLRGAIPGRIAGTTSEFTISDALNVFAFRPDLNLTAFLRALQGKRLLQILAEPTLVTTEGKEASFLVGGEFPVPIVQGGNNAGAVTVQFREFGIRLTFQPEVTAHNTIKMHVKPEVSAIDLANAVVFSGFTIPALSTRRMETYIELGEGQSFVIGGLMDDRVTETLSRIPGLSSLPILGELFKSRNESKSKTELIVMVTPEITEPLEVGAKAPIPSMPKTFLAPITLPGKPSPEVSQVEKKKEQAEGE